MKIIQLAVLAILGLFFIFNPGVFHYFFVMTLLCLPVYLLINKWLNAGEQDSA